MTGICIVLDISHPLSVIRKKVCKQLPAIHKVSPRRHADETMISSMTRLTRGRDADRGDLGETVEDFQVK
jgi:hypothetical protein